MASPRPNTGVVGADALGPAVERLDEGGHELRGEASAPVFSMVSHGVSRASAPVVTHDGPCVRQVVDDGVVHEVGRQLKQEGV